MTHELQHARLLCSSLYPTVCSNSCPRSQWCHSTISSSVIQISSCPQFFWASGSFPMNQLCTSGGQSIGASASASVLPMNIQSWFPLGLTCLISLLSKGLSRVYSSTTARKCQFFGTQPFLWSNPHIHTRLLEKPVLTIQTFVGKVISLLFNKLSRFVIAILPRSKCLNFVAAVTIHWFWSLRKMKSDTISTFSLSNCYEVIGPDAMILLFKCCFKPAFSLSSFTLIKRLFGSS